MGALNELSTVQGYHFMLVYAGERSCKFCGSLASALSMEGKHVWMDVYRLENAFDASHTIWDAANKSAYLVLAISPEFLTSASCCAALYAATERDNQETIIYMDRSLEWESRQYDRTLECLKQEGLQVCTSAEALIEAIDNVLMSPDDHISRSAFKT